MTVSATTTTAGVGRNTLARDMITLTKPRIISLLLLTTIAPMFVAGTPGLGLILIVALGGYLMAGGAKGGNMYFDRGIEDRMARTKLRPLSSGGISGETILAFGVALGAA